MKNLLFLPLLPVVVCLAGCVTHITTSVTQNPPPAEKFSDFGRIEITRIKLPPPYAGQQANDAALTKIQANVDHQIGASLAEWNAKAPTRTLLVEAVVPEIKFINATSRVWAGALAGSSAVKLRVRITDKETGAVIATPEFYARAAAMAGAWSFGSADNAMLIRIATRFTDYLKANYPQAVGGPTGAEPGK